ncbi:DUF2269 family protein [Pseudodesulfovibrio pelocollis]|uniref:DUF2269 family protein n=1 Tax=Pseudodesulfovibrio pelocollis TaxID=3051432 RepID=UPI00255B0078|nr:DUF2269 family protein [Pseudodesulfovibrio sp. SB368]
MIGRTGQRWLKGLHLLAVACWVGGGVSLLMLYFLKAGVDDGGVLYGMNQAIHHVDMAVVVIPGAFGCLLTGLAYSLLTGWGFFRHGWLILKWVATVAAILFGTFFLGPWETAMMNISGELGLAALDDPAYLANQRLNFVWGAVQVAGLVALIWISVFKPWKNLRSKRR